MLARKDHSALFADWYDLIRQNAQYGSGGEDAVEMAFMYQMTDSSRYLDLPRDFLFSITDDFIDSTIDNELTRVAVKAAFVYDWAGPGFSGDEDDSARANLIRLAEYHYDWVYNYDSNHFIEEGNGFSNNHNFGHQGALALLAITLPEHPLAQRWLEIALNYQFEQFRYYIREAPYYEGSHFSDVLIDLAIIPFYSAYSHACGIDVFDDARVPLERMFYSTLVEQCMPDFHTDPTRGAPENYVHITRQEGKRPDWRLLVSLLHRPEDPNWALGDPMRDGEIGDVWRLIFPYVTYDEGIPFGKAPEITPTRYLSGNDEIVFRRDWSAYSSFLHLYGRKIPTGPHGHCDQLTFNIFAHGARLATDFENDANSLDRSRPEYHNVIMADGEMTVDRYGYPVIGQPLQSVLDPTTLDLFFRSPSMDVGELSVDYAYTGNFIYSDDDTVDLTVGDVSVSRTVFYVKDMNIDLDNEYWIIADDVDADRSHDYEWLFHGVGSISGAGNESRTFTTTNDKGENVSLLVEFVCPPVEIVERGQSFYGQHIAAQVYGEDLGFRTILYPWITNRMSRPVVTGIEGRDRRGFTLTLHQGGDVVEDLFYSQGRNRIAQGVNGTRSDAGATFVRKVDDEVYSIFLKHGSWIEQNEVPILESSNNLDALSLTYRGMDGSEVIEGSLLCSSETEVTFYDPAGEEVQTERFAPGSHTITLPIGE